MQVSNNYRKAYGQLGYYYLIDNELRHVDNSLKCWKLYFDDPETIKGIESYDYFDLHTTTEYIVLSIENNIELIYLPLIEECLDFIDMQMHNNIVRYQNSGHEPDFKEYLISRMKKGIAFIDQYNN